MRRNERPQIVANAIKGKSQEGDLDFIVFVFLG
jgi:hypothetical protein